MSNKIDTRYAIGRKEANAYNTQELRDAFLVDTLMTQGEVVWIYTHYERFMLGSAVPTTSALTLETIEDQLKMPFFTARREVGVINIGGPGTITVSGTAYHLDNEEALYIGQGKIINIASMLSYTGGITVPAYTASKHAIAGLTKALANEWGQYNVQVNAIAPGYIKTDNTQALQDDETRSAEICARIPANRWGESDDLAGAAVFLASAASNYVNGHILAVDGGFLAR